MRILRLDFGPDVGSADLHPFISVVHGLDAGRSSRLVSAIRAMVSGSGLGLAGLVEHGGHLVEITAGDVGNLGPFTTEDVLLGLDRLHGGPDALPGLLAELDQRQRAARIDAVWVEEVRADLVPSAAARVQELRDLIDGCARPRIDLDAQHRREVIRAAIARVDNTPPAVRDVAPGVEELIAEWDHYVELERAASGHMESISARVRRAEAALADAMRFLADAEADARPVLLDRADEERLEELAHPKVERRFLGRDKSGDHDEELAAILAKVNQPTYSAYAMYRLSPTPPPEKVAVVDAANRQVADAQAEVDEARAALAEDQTARELQDHLELVRAEARLIFGPMLPSDLGRALREHVVESPNPEWSEALRDLYDAMVACGIEIPDTLEPERLPIWADDWVLKQERAEAASGVVDPAELQADLDAAEAALDRHARAMARIDRLEANAAESRLAVAELERQIARIENGETSPVQALYEEVVELAERVRENAGVAIPIILRGNFGDLTDAELSELMERLEPLAQSMQLVVVTDRNAAATWARNAGVRRALCASTAV